MTLEPVIEKPTETPTAKAAIAPGKNTYPPQRILLVDDDADIRQLNGEVLIAAGYQVDTAEDGEVGWKVLHVESYTPDSYDLLITDNNMPKISGIQLIRKLRSEHMTLPVILASGSAPTNIESLRITAILTKPFSPDQLVQTVKKALHTATRKLFNYERLRSFYY